MRVLLATLVLMLMVAACAKPSERASAEPSSSISHYTGEAVHPQDNEDPQPRTIDDLRAESLAAVDQEACAAKGGEVRQEGLLGTWRCTVPFTDAGKACRDKADCVGKCFLPPESEAATGDEATGACQATDSPFGCYAEIIDGKIVAALCVD